MRSSNSIIRILFGFAMLGAASAAHAGRPTITVVFEPGNNVIPALGTTGLIVVALLMAVIAVRMFKVNGNAGKTLGIMLLVGGGVVGMVASEHANSILPPEADVVLEGGKCQGTRQDYGSSGSVEAKNMCPTPQEVIKYLYRSKIPSCATLVESCPEGTVLPRNGTCVLNYYDFSGCDAS